MSPGKCTQAGQAYSIDKEDKKTSVRNRVKHWGGGGLSI